MEVISHHIAVIKEAGIVGRLISKNSAHKLPPTIQAVDSAGQPFSYYHFLSSFIILFVGIVASVVAISLELCVKNLNRHQCTLS